MVIIKEFLDTYLLPFTLLSDPCGEARSLYGATKGFGLLSGRYNYTIDKSGVVRHIHERDKHAETHRRGAADTTEDHRLTCFKLHL